MLRINLNDQAVERQAIDGAARVVGCRRSRQAGFSLLEMLVVIVIIGLLAGLVGPRLFGKVDASKQKTAEAQVKMLKGALQTYRLDVGTFPTDEQGLRILYDKPTGDARIEERWKGPYLDESVPVDPWDNPYQYKRLASGPQPFALYSFGADGLLGGEGYDADLGYLP